MARRVRGAAVLAALGCAVAATAPLARLSAQGPAVDNAVARARAMVEAGDGRRGRLVLDSLVQDAGVATPALGELLYWRGLLSESSTAAERDWRRLLLEVPMSPRAEDALLRLAQLEQLRGRPAASRAFLERMIRDYRDPASQARAHFWLAKSWFDENDSPRACGALDVVRRDAPSNAVELRTQSDDLRRRCRGVTAVAPIAVVAAAASTIDTAQLRAAREAAVRDSVQRASVVADAARSTAAREQATRDSAARALAVRDSAARAVALRDSVTRAAAMRDVAARDSLVRTNASAAATVTERPENARFSVQLAALNTMRQAEQFAERFRRRGIEARVDGTVAPFRVRTGYYVTRAQAAARLAELKAQQGLDGFVAELTP